MPTPLLLLTFRIYCAKSVTEVFVARQILEKGQVGVIRQIESRLVGARAVGSPFLMRWGHLLGAACGPRRHVQRICVDIFIARQQRGCRRVSDNFAIRLLAE